VERVTGFAYQISTIYLNARLSYNYFRFPKGDVRHIGILLPVSSLTGSRHRHGNIASVYQINRNRSTRGGVMTSYRFFEMATGSHVGFRVGNIRPPTEYNCDWVPVWSTNLESIGCLLSEILLS